MPADTAEQEQTLERHGLSDEVYHKDAPFGGGGGIKQVDMENRVMEGFSAGIGNEDQGRDIIMPGAFQVTIQERVPAGRIKLLDQHSPHTTDNVWGKVIDAEERPLSPDQREKVADLLGIPVDEAPSHRLWSKFSISRKERAQDALRDVEDGILDGLSIGFRTVRVEFVADDDVDLQEQGIDAEIAWLRGQGIRKIHELAWWETSLVVWPMNRAARPIPSSIMNTLSRVADLEEGENGEEPGEKEIRYAIKALEGMLDEEPEKIDRSVTPEALKEVSEKIDHALETMANNNNVPQEAEDRLETLYKEFEEAREDVGRDDFVEWVDGKIDALEVEDSTEEKEESEDQDESEEEGAKNAYDVPISDVKLLDVARDPCFTDAAEGEVPEGFPPSLSDFIEAEGWDAETWDDLSQDQKESVVCTTLLGEVADTFEESMMFNATDADHVLQENALVAVLGGRGAQADISEDQLESARSKAEALLEEEFDRDMDEEDSEDPDLEEDDIEEDAEEAKDSGLEEVERDDSAERDEILAEMRELKEVLGRIYEADQPDESDESDDSTPSDENEVAGASEDPGKTGGNESGEGRSDQRFEEDEGSEPDKKAAEDSLARLHALGLELED